MRYALCAIAFLSIVLVITFHANHVTLSLLPLFSESMTLNIAYHVSLEDSDNSDDLNGF